MIPHWLPFFRLVPILFFSAFAGEYIDIQITPTSQTVKLGDTAHYAIRVSPLNGFNATVTLSGNLNAMSFRPATLNYPYSDTIKMSLYNTWAERFMWVYASNFGARLDTACCSLKVKKPLEITPSFQKVADGDTAVYKVFFNNMFYGFQDSLVLESSCGIVSPKVLYAPFADTAELRVVSEYYGPCRIINMGIYNGDQLVYGSTCTLQVDLNVGWVIDSGIGAYPITSLIAADSGVCWLVRFSDASKIFRRSSSGPWTRYYGCGSVSGPNLFLQDVDGFIWSSFNTPSPSRVCCFNDTECRNTSEYSPISEKSVSGAVQDSSGNLWFSYHQGGVCKYDGMFWTDFSDSSARYYDIAIDSENQIWAPGKWSWTNTYWMIKIDPESMNFVKYPLSGWVSKIWIDRRDNRWLLSGDYGTSALCKFDMDTGIRILERKDLGYQVNDAAFEDHVAWFATDGGVLKHQDSTWLLYTSANSGLISNKVSCVEVDSAGNKWFGTDKGLVLLKANSSTVDIGNSQKNSSVAPNKIIVHPNPFNPSTSIEIDFTAMADLSVAVLDIRGRTVKTLHHGVFPGGQRTFSFDGTHLSSGFYFLYVRADKSRFIKKMILLR